MYYVITKDDNFVGIILSDAYQLGLQGVSISEMDGNIPDLNTNTWDNETGEFKESTSKLTKLRFLNRFTMAERIAIRASTDPIVIDIMNLFDAAEYITLTDINTQQGIGYLGVVGILSQARIAEILS